MARFKKKVMGVGFHVTPDGVQKVDRARMERWVDAMNRMAAAGHPAPLSWGHAPSAEPHSKDDAAFWGSKLVAGEVLSARIDPKDGELEIEGDAPGAETDGQGRLVTTTELPDGRRVKSAIREVSIGVRDWTDGKGRKWEDAPIHVALTPLPVWVPEGGQPPFEAIDGAAKAAHFGTASLLARFATEGAVADEEKKDPPGDGEGDAAPEVGLSEVLDALASIGLSLPESTTEATLMRDIVVGCAAIAGADADADADAGAAGDAAPAEGAAGAGGAFMSTLRNDPLGLGLIQQLEGQDRERRLARLKALQARGLPAHQAAKLREQVTAVRFSTDPRGNVLRPAVDDVLDVLEATLPPEGEGPMAALFGAAVPTPPEGDEQAERRRDERVADEMARSGGLPPRQRGA